MRRWACGTLVLVAVGWLLPSQALAATYTVTKTTDTADGSCNADCSLREAVIAANATPSGTDTIVVPAGTYSLTLDGAGENLAETGDLDLTGEHVDIVGAGVGLTVVDAGEMAGPERPGVPHRGLRLRGLALGDDPGGHDHRRLHHDNGIDDTAVASGSTAKRPSPSKTPPSWTTTSPSRGGDLRGRR